MRGEQRFSIDLLCNFLKVYASIFDFLQCYVSNLSKSSSLTFQFLCVREALYCNFMRPAHCKEMGIITYKRATLPITLPLRQGYRSNLARQLYRSTFSSGYWPVLATCNIRRAN